MSQIWKPLAMLAVAAWPSSAQVIERRAALNGGPSGGPGKCTIEVVVDVAAEVEIRGDSALLRTLGGQPSQWRRFQCTSPMPVQPVGFRFSGVDGRGRQQLQMDPQRGGPAVIHIEDPQGGAEGYTFDITWNGAAQQGSTGGFGNGSRGGDRNRPPDFNNNRPPDYNNNRPPGGDQGFGRPYQPDEAVHACEEAAIDQATDRFHAQGVVVRRSAIDNGPGRNDWVVGTLETRRGRDWDVYQFSCSVDFRGRRIRTVDLKPMGPRR